MKLLLVAWLLASTPLLAQAKIFAQSACRLDGGAGCSSGAGGGVPFSDASDVVYNSVDSTKRGKFSLSGISTGTTRTWTWPDASGTVTLLGNASSGSGSVVLATSPILVTPNIGAATATSVAGVAGTTLALSGTAPAQTTTTQAGTGITVTASNAVAGSSVAGAAAGGPVTITSGDAARLTSGNANGGNITLVPGAGIGTGTPGKVIVPAGTSSRADFVLAGSSGNAGISGTSSITYFWGGGTTSFIAASGLVGIGTNTLYGGSAVANTDVAFSRAAASTWKTDAGGGGAASYIQITAGESRVTTQFDATSNTTLANITGLTSTLIAGRKYRFRGTFFIAADAIGGIKLAVAGTATATSVVYQINAIRNDTSVFAITSRQTALGGSAATAAATAYFVEIVGTIVCNAAGTLVPQFAQSASNGTSSVLVNSTWNVVDIQ